MAAWMVDVLVEQMGNKRVASSAEWMAEMRVGHWVD